VLTIRSSRYRRSGHGDVLARSVGLTLGFAVAALALRWVGNRGARP
jgi:hypothetical protein